MHWLEKHWYRISALQLLLWPLSLLFGTIAAMRRALYRADVLARTRLAAPVIVIGNISVGGTGKTPLTIWLVTWLRSHGMKPGIICRGYGGNVTAPQRVLADSDPRQVGDEAVLLARRCACPVWVGIRRADAGRALLAMHPECDVIISDDGLQHYALQRDAAIAVIDGERGFGNGMLLPAGPLREPVRRLQRVDGIVINGDATFAKDCLPPSVPVFDLSVAGTELYALADPAQHAMLSAFRGRRVHAVAGIGNPRRFFEHLRGSGISCTDHAFPDHHAFSETDLDFGDTDAVIMTEKDAVKCERLNRHNIWVLRANARVDPACGELLLSKIGK